MTLNQHYALSTFAPGLVLGLVSIIFYQRFNAFEGFVTILFIGISGILNTLNFLLKLRSSSPMGKLFIRVTACFLPVVLILIPVLISFGTDIRKDPLGAFLLAILVGLITNIWTYFTHLKTNLN